MEPASETSQKQLGDYFVLLRRHWIVFLVSLIVAMGLAAAYLHFAPKTYESVAAVLVTSPTSGFSPSSANPNAVSTTINLDTEAQMVTATPTLDGVAKALHLSPADEANLTNDVSVTVPPSTEILDIAYQAGTPKAAQAGARAFADAYLAQRAATATAGLTAAETAVQSQIDPLNASLAKLVQSAAGLSPTSVDASRNYAQQTTINNQLSNLTAQLNQLKSTTVTPGQIVTQPELPTSPSSPNTLITLAAGLVLGILAGIGIAALRHRSDDRVRSPEDLFQRTRVPALSVFSGQLAGADTELVAPLSADGRGYARLRNLVSTGLESAGERSVLVAGVGESGGPVAANLAASLARADEQVYLICGDVYGSTAEALLGTAPVEGLAQVLAGERRADEVVRSPAELPNLRVLAPGKDTDRADALLQTRSPRRLVDELLANGAYVVIEAPPTRESADAQTLAHAARLAILVVATGHTSARDVLDACAQFESVHADVFGAVIGRYASGSAANRKKKRKNAATVVSTADTDGPAGAGAREGVEPVDGRSTREIPVASLPESAEHDVLPTVSRPALVPPGSRGTSGS